MNDSSNLPENFTDEDIVDYYNSIPEDESHKPAWFNIGPQEPVVPENKFAVTIMWKTKTRKEEVFEVVDLYIGYGEVRLIFADGVKKTIPFSSIWYTDVEELY